MKRAFLLLLLMVSWVMLAPALAVDETTVIELQTDVEVTKNKADENADNIKAIAGGLPALEARVVELEKGGVQGLPGPQGEQGIAGPEGPMGPQGLAGDVGPVGPQGEVGPQGPVGRQGERGIAGQEGPMGPQGPQGEVGSQGDVGPTGLMGPKGDNGLHCWDLNLNGMQDPEEDIDGNGIFDALDCRADNTSHSHLKRVEYLAIPCEAFVPPNSTTEVRYLNGKYTPGVATRLSAPVNIPNGAIIKNVKIRWHDSSEDKDLGAFITADDTESGTDTVNLIRYGLLSSIGSSDAMLYVDERAITGKVPPIDNSQYTYVLEVGAFPAQGGFNTSWPTDGALKIRSAIIEYELPAIE